MRHPTRDDCTLHAVGCKPSTLRAALARTTHFIRLDGSPFLAFCVTPQVRRLLASQSAGTLSTPAPASSALASAARGVAPLRAPVASSIGVGGGMGLGGQKAAGGVGAGGVGMAAGGGVGAGVGSILSGGGVQRGAAAEGRGVGVAGGVGQPSPLRGR